MQKDQHVDAAIAQGRNTVPEHYTRLYDSVSIRGVKACHQASGEGKGKKAAHGEQVIQVQRLRCGAERRFQVAKRLFCFSAWVIWL